MTQAQTPWKRAGVMGLGLSGVAAAGFLARRGTRVTAWDDTPADRLSPEAKALAGIGVQMSAGPARTAFDGCEAVIASPGVPGTAPALAAARSAGIPILAEVELASRYLRGVLIGITGSNGKSTVTALTGEILKTAGIPTRICGNIGTPLTQVVEADESLPDAQARGVHYVAELSSFQLEGIETLRPHIAVLLNLSPDHQDRYESTEDYYAAKSRIFMNQRGDDIAVVNWDDAASRPHAERLAARLFPFSLAQDLEEGAVLQAGKIMVRRGGKDDVVMPASRVPLKGRHNLENALAAASVAVHCGASLEAVAAGIEAFRGLPHRLEFVREVGGVSYYNDSKATNVGATLRALEAFDVPVVLLLGGYDKGGDFESLREPLRGKLRALVTFGKAGGDIAARLDGAAPKILETSSLADAIRTAAATARSGDVVLLAPGCASFDAYTGFEKRGEDFKAQVGRLATQAGGLA